MEQITRGAQNRQKEKPEEEEEKHAHVEVSERERKAKNDTNCIFSINVQREFLFGLFSLNSD